jgi:hypothetical protein
MIVPLITVATAGAGWTEVYAGLPAGGDGFCTFNNVDGAVAYLVSFNGTDTHLDVPAYGSRTTPKEVDLAAGVWIKRVGATDVSVSTLSIQL